MGEASRAPDRNRDQEPGHYGAGYGEQVAAETPPQLGPTTDGDQSPGATADDSAPAGKGEAPPTQEGDDGSPVVFTPDDVHARPPDHPPTDAAPESEKSGLIFERS